MKRLFLSFFIVFGTLVLLSSCVEEIDANQFDDLSITPTLEASLVYIESSEAGINAVVNNTVFSNEFNFDAFSTEVFADRVIEGSIIYVIENTTSKELNVMVEFLDDAGTVLDTENFMIPAAPTAILQREVVYGPTGRSLDIIRNLSSFGVTALNLGDSSSTSAIPEPKITLQSTGKFRVRVK